MLLKNTVSIITGGSRGIGKAIAFLFAKEGSDIVLADIDLEGIKNIADEITSKTGRKCIAINVDISKKADVEKMVSATMKEFGKVDVLVNNAGILLHRPILDMTEEEWDRVIDVDLKGYFLCSQAAGREMVKKKRGRIIHISSCSAKKPSPEEAAYSAAKAGILGFNRVLAAELGPYGINCNSILPGATDTEMIRSTFLTSSDIEEEWIDKTALKKLGKPEDIAKVALFLASDLSSHITGEVIVVSAGEMMSQ
jgi:NAD(P)-dependent dehydrogenase (short-subunit alcohol dehydrogenase family)